MPLGDVETSLFSRMCTCVRSHTIFHFYVLISACLRSIAISIHSLGGDCKKAACPKGWASARKATTVRRLAATARRKCAQKDGRLRTRQLRRSYCCQHRCIHRWFLKIMVVRYFKRLCTWCVWCDAGLYSQHCIICVATLFLIFSPSRDQSF